MAKSKNQNFGVGDRVKILHCSNLMLVGKVSKIASICGTGSTKYYHLEIDGELKIFLSQNLQLVEKYNNNPKK